MLRATGIDQNGNQPKLKKKGQRKGKYKIRFLYLITENNGCEMIFKKGIKDCQFCSSDEKVDA